MRKLLIKGGCLLSMDQRTGNHRVADLLIEGETITEIGGNLRARDAEVIDADDTIVMPGFVDTHRHLLDSLLRGLGSAADADGLSASLGRHYSADDIYAATLIGLLGAAEAGITTVVDWSSLDRARLDAALQAHMDAGLRTVMVRPLSDGTDLQPVADDETAAHSHPLATLATSPHEPVPEDLDRAVAEWAAARDLGLRIHTHVHGAGAAVELAARGLLGPDVTLIHCSGFANEDFDAIASSGASVALTPSSDMAEGTQPPPMQSLIDRGIRPGLGVGSERNAPGDIFAPMRAAISLQHATSFDLKLAGKGAIPQLLSTRDAIRYATTDGARVAGLDDVTGSLAPGKQADFILLRTDRPNISPINDPIGAVVWGMDTSNVDSVFVAGKAVMRNGELQADTSRARTMALAAQQRVLAASGLLPDTGTRADR